MAAAPFGKQPCVERERIRQVVRKVDGVAVPEGANTGLRGRRQSVPGQAFELGSRSILQ